MTTNKTHTAGPWQAGTKDGASASIRPQRMAVVGDHPLNLEADANARLIAAAPDLLEAIRPLLFEVEQLLISTKHFPECAVKMSRRCAVEQAQAAIQRATEGRT